MKTSQQGLDLIKRFEGCELKAYQCPAGIWTIGYGHTSEAGAPVVRRGMKITATEAEAILARDLGQYERSVIDHLTHSPTQSQFDAMVSLCYNIGPAAFGFSSIVREFNSGNKAKAADAFRKWNKGGGKVLPGLIRRREDERTLFLSGGTKAAPEPQKPPVALEKPKTGQDMGAAGAVAGGASLAHYFGVSLQWIGAAVVVAAIAYVAWRIYRGRK